jgi:4-carboxymuconolactone decarboxylase
LISVLDVPYVFYCHHKVAKNLGFSDEQYSDGFAGKVPQGLSEEEVMAYRLGRTLPLQSGPLDDTMWDQITSVMKKSEFVAILHTIAGYRWVSMLEHANGEDRRWSKSR